MAQLVERDLAKVEAAGSSPVSRSGTKEEASKRMPLLSCQNETGSHRHFMTVRISAREGRASVGAKQAPLAPSTPSRA